MIVMDGNNSLKRLATRESQNASDKRAFESDYFLPREFVDRFANEVKTRQPQAKPQLGVDDSSDSEDDSPPVARAAPAPQDDGPDPTDGATEPSPCASNWKAASAEERKRMWGVFEETGIFACACRHGIILWLADLYRSGEL